MTRFSLTGYIGMVVAAISGIFFLGDRLNMIEAGGLFDKVFLIFFQLSYLIVLVITIIEVIVLIYKSFKKEKSIKSIYSVVFNIMYLVASGLYFLSMQTV